MPRSAFELILRAERKELERQLRAKRSQERAERARGGSWWSRLEKRMDEWERRVLKVTGFVKTVVALGAALLLLGPIIYKARQMMHWRDIAPAKTVDTGVPSTALDFLGPGYHTVDAGPPK